MSNKTPTALEKWFQVQFEDAGDNPFPQRPTVKLASGLTATDDAANNRTILNASGGGGGSGQFNVTLVNGANENVNTNGLTVLRIGGPTAAFSVGGFLAPASSGTTIVVVNTTIYPMTIVHEDAGSTAVNRIDTGSTRPLTLPPRKGTATFTYDTTSTRWVLQSAGYLYARGFDVRDFGAACDGVTDDRAAIVNADAAAQAAGTHLHFPPATCHVGSSTPITSDVEFAPTPGGNLSGTFVLNGAIRAWPTQQIFAAGALITLTIARPTSELWIGWWGAKGNGATDDSAAIQAALTCWSNIAINRVAPTLRFPGGVFLCNSPLVINGCLNGGSIRGAGRYQTQLFMNIAGGQVGLDQRNCVGFNVWGITVACNGGPTTTLTATAAAGTSALALTAALTGLAAGSVLMVASAGSTMYLNNLSSYEKAVVTAVAGTAVTVNSGVAWAAGQAVTTNSFTTFAGAPGRFYRVQNAGSGTTGAAVPGTIPTGVGALTSADANGVVWECMGTTGLQGSYFAGDSAMFLPLAAWRVFEDSTSGESSNNSYDECSAGRQGLFSEVYGLALDFNRLGADVNNPNHHFARFNCDGGMEAACYLSGLNLENVTFVDSQFTSQGYGIETHNASSFALVNPGFAIGKYDVFITGGQQADKSTIFGGYSESAGGFLYSPASGGGGFLDLTVVGFSRKGASDFRIINTIAAGTTTLPAANDAFAQGLFPGELVDIYSWDGTVHETVTVDHVPAGGTSVVIAAPGLANTYTKGANAYAASVATRVIDVTSTTMQLHLYGTFLTFGATGAGQLMAFHDPGGAGVVEIRGCRGDPVGFIADGVAVTRSGNYWQQTNSSKFLVTKLNGAVDVNHGDLTGIPNAGATALSPGQWYGVTHLYGDPTVVPATATGSNDPNGEIQHELGVIRVTHAMSPYTATLPNVVYVTDSSGGAVTITLPVLAANQWAEVAQDESTALTGTITVNAGTGQTLARPSPNVGSFSTSITSTSGDIALGVGLRWKNFGSGGSPAKLLLD